MWTLRAHVSHQETSRPRACGPWRRFWRHRHEPALHLRDCGERVSGVDPIGVASLIVWSLLLIVTLKYVGVVMRADYRGEGGVFALLALLKQKSQPTRARRLPAYVLMLLFGAALL